jgi:hypothetical protein
VDFLFAAGMRLDEPLAQGVEMTRRHQPEFALGEPEAGIVRARAERPEPEEEILG